jgi:hypothetical protein
MFAHTLAAGILKSSRDMLPLSVKVGEVEMPLVRGDEDDRMELVGVVKGAVRAREGVKGKGVVGEVEAVRRENAEDKDGEGGQMEDYDERKVAEVLIEVRRM